MSSSMLMRPKSIATVVVVLRSTPVSRSMPLLASVSSASVCSGRISVTAQTMVVWPAPKPPAIRILIETGVLAGLSAISESAKPIGDPPEELRIRQLRWRYRPVNHDEASVQKVSENDPDHPDGQLEVGPEICHRRRHVAQAQHRQVLGVQISGIGQDPASRRHPRARGDSPARGPGPAADKGVGADDGSCLIVQPPLP